MLVSFITNKGEKTDKQDRKQKIIYVSWACDLEQIISPLLSYFNHKISKHVGFLLRIPGDWFQFSEPRNSPCLLLCYLQLQNLPIGVLFPLLIHSLHDWTRYFWNKGNYITHGLCISTTPWCSILSTDSCANQSNNSSPPHHICLWAISLNLRPKQF